MTLKLEAIIGRQTYDPYKLPPCVAITECDIAETLGFCTSMEMRKYYACAIIVGQPFNRGRH